MTPTEMHINALMEKIERLKAERDEYKEALNWYAHQNNWYIEGTSLDHTVIAVVHDDDLYCDKDDVGIFRIGGMRAKAVLEKWKGKE